jgi:hypothetical protein
MGILEIAALVGCGVFVIFIMCYVSYSIGLKHGIKYMTDLLDK